MINKILVWLGIALTAILIIENMVITNNSYFFIDSTSKSWIVALATNFIGIAIWFWLSWMLKKNSYEDDDNVDF